MSKRILLKESVNMAEAIFGVICFAFAYRLFIVPSGLYSGGFTGLSQLIKIALLHIINIELPADFDLTGIIFWMINLPLILLSHKHIGRKFFIRTVILICIQSYILSLIPSPKEPIFSESILNVVVGGSLSGFGVGTTLRAGGSGGGTDIIGMYCAKRFPGFSVGKISIAINVFIYFTAAVLSDINIAAYSMIYSLFSSIVVDRVHAQNIRLVVFIVSKNKELRNAIIHTLKRGVTSWQGWGEYTHSDTCISITAINQYELPTLRRMIAEYDKHAFVIVTSPKALFGNFEKRLEV